MVETTLVPMHVEEGSVLTDENDRLVAGMSREDVVDYLRDLVIYGNAFVRVSADGTRQNRVDPTTVIVGSEEESALRGWGSGGSWWWARNPPGVHHSQFSRSFLGLDPGSQDRTPVSILPQEEVIDRSWWQF